MGRKRSKSRWHLKALAWPAALLYELWRLSMRIRCVNLDYWYSLKAKHGKLILCLWHDELFALPGYRRTSRLKFTTIVSRSRDAELLAGILTRLDIVPARGSSSRGGAGALVKVARLMNRHGRDGVVTVDGPRGPRHKAKDGAIYLANMTGAAIVPVRLFYSRRKIFGSWDRFQLPAPFSSCTIKVGDPIVFDPTPDLPRDRIKELTLLLEERLSGILREGA